MEREAYIVTSIRTPGCKKGKGGFKDTRPENLLSFILKTIIDKTPGLGAEDIDDTIIGCAFPEAEQGLNIGRLANQMAGFPVQVSGATVNRFCASGLEAIALSTLKVRAGWSDIVIGGGIESMTFIPMGGHRLMPHPEWSSTNPEHYIAMGITAENVAKRYNIAKKDQDEFALSSHKKAAYAQEHNLFTEIVPTPAYKFVKQNDGKFKKQSFMVHKDDGVRPGTTIEVLSKLQAVFSAQGTVTAGNSSQTTDGAAATLIVSKDKCKELGLKPIAKLKYYNTVGCKPDEMGVGPRYAIPKLLKQAGMNIKDIGLFEINEAFASQVLYCCQSLNIDMDSVNIHGGAIALGHPLGCTGAKLLATLIANLKEKNKQFGVEAMCIGGGMGAAALIEML